MKKEKSIYGGKWKWIVGHQNINWMQIKAESLILEGNPKDMICEICEEMNVDLLIVGSRGLGKIKR